MKKPSKKESFIHDLNGLSVPVDIYYEYRRNVRCTIGKKAAILRLPKMLLPTEKQKHWKWFESFLLKNEAYLIEHFKKRVYKNGTIISTRDKEYELSIEESDNKSHSGKLKNGIIYLKINKTFDAYEEAIKTILSRVIASDHQATIERKVRELNHIYFRVPVGKVNLKYTTSRWGSCSSKGNINLSTRLLFAPEDVLDYVIIHELAHRKEMNHSSRFWNLVAGAMPDYKEKEKWLKEHGKTCDF